MANIVNKIWEALGMGQKQGEEIDEEELIRLSSYS